MILIFARMARLDAFYCDKHFAYFSRVRLPGYYTFSENMQMKYPGFVLNDSLGLVENISNYDVNLDTVLNLLRSKDHTLYERMKNDLFSGQSLYTTGNAKEQQSIAYVTYPRSGNSLMRKYFENITGIASGSDMVMKYCANIALQFCGFKAEGIVDSRAWIKKSHYPFITPF
jgi:hypothetical protein